MANYPEVKNVKPNQYYVRLLQQDYAGMVSEMTAISLYVYNHVILDAKSEELAKLFSKVSLAEMRHLEALGEAIVAFGGDPRYGVSNKKRQYRYWNGRYVEYRNKVCTILQTAIRGERQAIEQYRKHRRLIKEPQTQALLTAIIADEKEHLRLFKLAQDKYRCKR